MSSIVALQLEFPFLIGRIRTIGGFVTKEIKRKFPFLIGRIRTFSLSGFENVVIHSFHSS